MAWTNVALAQRLWGDRLRKQVPLSRATTYRLGGPVRAMVILESTDDLHRVTEYLDQATSRVVVLGRGSNLLVSDRGLDALCIRLGAGFRTYAIEGEYVRAGGAVSLWRMAAANAARGLGGLEWFAGIPGTVGGAVAMNAGAHGGEVATSLIRATIYDLRTSRTCTVGAADLAFSIRGSGISPETVVTEATFAVTLRVPADCVEHVRSLVRWRRRHQPVGRNAGSVFVSHPANPAGKLIEGAGCKGWRVGGAIVSDVHANWIQAEHGATARDVDTLARRITAHVRATSGVTLGREIRTWGRFSRNDSAA